MKRVVLFTVVAMVAAAITPAFGQENEIPSYGTEIVNQPPAQPVAGLQDPTGPQGPAGARGPAGSRGPQGLQGPAGHSGETRVVFKHDRVVVHTDGRSYERSSVGPRAVQWICIADNRRRADTAQATANQALAKAEGADGKAEKALAVAHSADAKAKEALAAVNTAPDASGRGQNPEEGDMLIGFLIATLVVAAVIFAVLAFRQNNHEDARDIIRQADNPDNGRVKEIELFEGRNTRSLRVKCQLNADTVTQTSRVATEAINKGQKVDMGAHGLRTSG